MRRYMLEMNANLFGDVDELCGSLAFQFIGGADAECGAVPRAFAPGKRSQCQPSPHNAACTRPMALMDSPVRQEAWQPLGRRNRAGLPAAQRARNSFLPRRYKCDPLPAA